MTDREKVIKEYEDYVNSYISLTTSHDYEFEMHKAVLALLKEQEAVEPFHRCIGKDFSLIEDSHFDYCPYCGKRITWAKQEGR